MPQCPLVRPLSIPDAGRGTGSPREWVNPEHLPLQVLADHGLTFHGHAKTERRGCARCSRYATDNFNPYMIFVAMYDAAEFFALPGGRLPLTAGQGRIACEIGGAWFPGVMHGLSRANSTRSWAATGTTAWCLTDLPRSKADAVEKGRAVDPFCCAVTAK
jgi:hypothetical protein